MSSVPILRRHHSSSTYGACCSANKCVDIVPWAGIGVTLYFCSVTLEMLARPHRLGSSCSYNWLRTTGLLVRQHNKVLADLCTILVLVDLIPALLDKQYHTYNTSTNCQINATLTTWSQSNRQVLIHQALPSHSGACSRIWHVPLSHASRSSCY